MIAKPLLIAKAFSDHAGCIALAEKYRSASSSRSVFFFYKSKRRQVSNKVVTVAWCVRYWSITWFSGVWSQMKGWFFFLSCFLIWKKKKSKREGKSGKVRERPLSLSHREGAPFFVFSWSLKRRTQRDRYTLAQVGWSLYALAISSAPASLSVVAEGRPSFIAILSHPARTQYSTV